MRKSLVISALLFGSCGPSAPSTTLPAPPASPEPERVVEPAPAPAPPPPLEVNADPDVPTGAAAQRDKELESRAAGFIDAFTNAGAVLTHDGKRVVFVSTRDGLPQLYIADATKPASPATRLVTTAQRVIDPHMLKGGKSLLFRSDIGADELWSVYRVDLDGKNVVDLTPGERLNRDGVILPARVKDTMFYSARKMSEPRSTVYSASTATPGPAKVIYTDELPAFLTDVDADGARGLVLQFPSRVENYLVKLDIKSGKTQPLFPAEGVKLSIFAAKFSSDGKRIYVGTDGGEEAAVVLALDAATGKEVARHAITPPSAQIGGIEVDPRTGTLALTLTIGNRGEIRLLDGKLTKATIVQMPLGSGSAKAFSDDGKRLTAGWSTPDKPNDVFAIDVKSGKVEPLRTEPRPSLTAMPAIETILHDIPAFDGGKIPTHVFLPKGEQQKPHPVLVVYHGGPSGVSTIRWSATVGYFLSLGYVVVEPNVRGSSGYGRAFEAGDNGPKRVDAFKDIETSGRWVAAQPWADKDRLVVYGGSYGGYTVLIALARWPEIWRAGVNLFGVVNLKTFMATTSGLIRKIFLVEFGDPDKDAAFLESISPLTDVGKIVDPLFVYAGANDPRVPRSESDLIVKAVRQRAIPTEYMVANDEGHSLSRRETQIGFYTRAARFLEQHLK